jgi:MFS family permease
MLKPSSEARREWRVGWPAVCAGLFGAAAAQIHFASIGIFIKPISDSMGWNTSTVTFGIFISAMVAVPGAPLAGWLAQKFGLIRIIMLGLPLFFLAFAGLGLLSHSKSEWIVGWTLVALGNVLVKSNLWMLWVAQKFDAARGMAFGMVMAGAGILAIFIPIVTQLIIESVGWRATFPVLAATMALMAIPACVLGFRACPPAAGERGALPGARRAVPSGMSIKKAVGSRSFWQIGLISFLIGAGLVSMQVHLVPMFRSKGLDAHTAALIAGMFGGSALAGRFIAGAFLDRYSARIIGMFSLLLPALASVMYLAFPIGPGAGAVTAILFGLGVGAEGDVLGYVTAKFFGVRSFGTIFGITTGLFALGAGIGPLTMALMLDHFGSYRPVMLVVFFTLLLCALLFVTLGAYPTIETSDGSSDLEELDGTEDREPAAAPSMT